MGDKVGNVSTIYCPYEQNRIDCDGAWDTYCTRNGNCKYKKNVRDCDGEIASFCRK